MDEPLSWQGPRPFVGREDVLGQLRQEFVTAMEHSGRAVILHGPPGSGRVALAERLLAPARQGRVRVATADAADPEEAAWSRIAHQLTARRRALRAVGRSAGGWLGLIPMVGGVVAAILDTAHALHRHRKGGAVEEGPRGTGFAVDHVRMLLAEAPDEPRLIILKNLEAADPDEMAGAFALAQRIGGTRTLLLGTSTSVAGRLPDHVALLRDELVRYRTGEELEIPPLTPEECLRAVVEATGSPVPVEWQDWLMRRAPGIPEDLWTLLGTFVAEGVLMKRDAADGGWEWTREPGPGDEALIAVPDHETSHLPERQQRIVSAAARIGTSFTVPHLAERLGTDELELQEQLDRLCGRGLLAFEETVEMGGELVDRYRFIDERTAARWAARPGT